MVLPLLAVISPHLRNSRRRLNPVRYRKQAAEKIAHERENTIEVDSRHASGVAFCGPHILSVHAKA